MSNRVTNRVVPIRCAIRMPIPASPVIPNSLSSDARLPLPASTSPNSAIPTRLNSPALGRDSTVWSSSTFSASRLGADRNGFSPRALPSPGA